MRSSLCTLLIAVGVLTACSQQASSPLPVQPANGSAFASAASRAPSVRVKYGSIYSFKGGSDASGPRAGVILVDGALYGTTFYGGSSGQGAVYKISPAGEKVLYSFKGGSDGANPSGDLLYYKGSLYGTTPNGGTGGTGTVFAVTLKGKEHVVYSFGGIGGTDADGPTGGLVEAGGVLYGVAPQGGAYGIYGAVFAVTPSGSEHIVYNFGLSGSNFGGDAYSPAATLAYANGMLYGTSFYGGTNNLGAVFALTTQGVEHVVYSFAGTADGALPTGGVIAANGVLYGTTTNGGCGPSSCGSPNCNSPSGESGGCGIVFAVNASTGAETVLHRFQDTSSDGANPEAALVQIKNVLYGTATIAGATGNGAVFKIQTNGKKEGLLYSFRGGPSDGATPQAVLLDAAGTLYGTTNGGGKNEDGTVFDLKP